VAGDAETGGRTVRDEPLQAVDVETGDVSVGAAISLTADEYRRRHRMDPRSPAEIAAEHHAELAYYSARQASKSWALANWARQVSDFIVGSRNRRAVTLHMSTEAARHSHAPRPKSVQQMMFHYARQSGRFGLDPLRLEKASPAQLHHVVDYGPPAFTGPQRRRMRKKLNRAESRKP
jgi:hypothetical protein